MTTLQSVMHDQGTFQEEKDKELQPQLLTLPGLHRQAMVFSFSAYFLLWSIAAALVPPGVMQ